ncbi:FAD:protein FMN transferase [Paenibacillus sediminis]|uniref:FAD:protein FMN transferase n=1 Tax=Paenibacillus sediminis TaxID=664909 RepID=A0ABS4H5Q9_9BACL|nr:FAD:protein FMN transferase [Paenibacillus sediminis]MBP1937862.1 thiamine biosynthesis lipoprotein [Paenibacillus sediminis]
MNSKTAETHVTDCFRTMNTEVEVQFTFGKDVYLYDGKPLQHVVRRWFENNERRFSRFLPSSELSQLNGTIGWMQVSAAMAEVLELAQRFYVITGGIFNPAILQSLEQSGYDVSFENLQGKKLRSQHNQERTYDAVSTGYILHSRTRFVSREPETRLDLGGIVKGWSVQRIADWLRHRVERGCINAGGDIAVWNSRGEPGKYWNISISDPADSSRDIGHFALENGAIATSSTMKRRWTNVRGEELHHIIDPRTMMPANSEVIQCTAIGRQTTECEMIAKTFCILGMTEGLHWVKRHYPTSELVWVTESGAIHYYGSHRLLSSRWKSFCPDVIHTGDGDLLEVISDD